MEAYLKKKKRPREPSPRPDNIATRDVTLNSKPGATRSDDNGDEEESTDIKLGMLNSLFPDIEQETLLDVLIANDGSIESAKLSILADDKAGPSRKKHAASSSNNADVQSSLAAYGIQQLQARGPAAADAGTDGPILTRKGKTLYLYSAEDVANHTPCSIIHNFLPSGEATVLLKELLSESETFHRQKFQLFDTVVESPHSAGFYVSSVEEQREQTSEYVYNGRYRKDVRQLTPELRNVSSKVCEAVNSEIQKRIASHYPDGKKLRYQSPFEWKPNAAFVNCYDGPGESVGYHSDELTYLGPRAVIGSLSLGVARELRVRRVVPPDEEDGDNDDDDDNGSSDKQQSAKSQTRADVQGQISIHLPHNSLLVMHAEMQEEWKHSIAPAQAITPHPVAGNKRINVTYRWYRESLHPRHTPRCRCSLPAILRCVQRKRESRGRYMWMCYAGYAPGGKSCGFFQWAHFDDDGEPIWDPKDSSNVV